MKQTAIDWYFDKIKSHFEHDGDLLETATFTYAIAKQKEKQQILDAFQYGVTEGTLTNINYLKCESEANHYYNETYGSKGSDNSPKVENKDSFGEISSQTEISDVSQGIALQNQLESKVITELSDKEIKRKIEKEIKKRYETTQNDAGFRDGWFLAIEWYREQLKSRQ